MSRIFAIDPGPEESAIVILENGAPKVQGIYFNALIQEVIRAEEHKHLVIESVTSYGMPVGVTVFETCYWIGRFDPDCKAVLMPRREVKLHLCNSVRAKDGNVRQALIDRFGPGKRKAIGLKKTPGPLYGFKADLWSALALAITYYDKIKETP